MGETRLDRTRERLAAAGVDVMLLHRNSDLIWLTGASDLFDSEEAHLAVITADEACIHTDSRYITSFLERRADFRGDWGCVTDPPRASDFAADFATEKCGGSRRLVIGVTDDIVLRDFRALERAFAKRGVSCEFKEMESPCLDLRAVKDPDEIDALKASQKVTDSAFSHMCEWMRTGMTEKEIALELSYTLRRMGADDLSFPPIVATGADGASPHSIPGDTRVKPGDALVMDFGATVGVYRSDMTRTVCFGKATGELAEVYAAVLEAHESAKKAIACGKRGSQIHAIAAGIIDEAGFAGRFGHGLGHGVGIDIHERPTLSPKSDTILMPGHVVTVEPGIYLPGRFGVRIEDFGVVTENGFSDFTASAHELIEL